MLALLDNIRAKISRLAQRAADWHHMSKFHGSPPWTLYVAIAAIFIALGILMLWEPLMHSEQLPRYIPR